MGFRKTSYTQRERHAGKHRFEHWYRDNSVYFLTSKVRDGARLFQGLTARELFWARLKKHGDEAGYVPWVTTVMSNHYHTLGYLKVGENLGQMMRKLHGGLAYDVIKLMGTRHKPFWRSKGNRDYFDGCIRDVLQATRAYRYVLNQAVRARLVRHWKEYPHTRINVEMERAIRRAVELNAFMEGVPYARYEKNKARRGHLR